MNDDYMANFEYVKGTSFRMICEVLENNKIGYVPLLRISESLEVLGSREIVVHDLNKDKVSSILSEFVGDLSYNGTENGITKKVYRCFYKPSIESLENIDVMVRFSGGLIVEETVIKPVPIKIYEIRRSQEDLARIKSIPEVRNMEFDKNGINNP